MLVCQTSSPLSPAKSFISLYISKAAIEKSERRLQEPVGKLILILEHSAKQGKSVDLIRGFHSLVTDLVMNFGWRRHLGVLDAPDFTFPSVVHIEQFFISTTILTALPNFVRSIIASVFRYPILATFSVLLEAIFHLRSGSLSHQLIEVWIGNQQALMKTKGAGLLCHRVRAIK